MKIKMKRNWIVIDDGLVKLKIWWPALNKRAEEYRIKELPCIVFDALNRSLDGDINSILLWDKLVERSHIMRAKKLKKLKKTKK